MKAKQLQIGLQCEFDNLVRFVPGADCRISTHDVVLAADKESVRSGTTLHCVPQ